MTMRAWVGLIAAGWAALPPVGPAAAQSWNLYGNGGSFYVPITTQPNLNGGPPQYLVSLTLNGSSQPNSFILDTGSLGLVADPNHYTFSPAKGDIQLAPYATITYSTSGANPVGALYLTNVQINGAGGQSVTARVPILGASNDGFHQLGIGFDRGGIMIGQNASSTAPASNSYNMNPFLALVSGTNTNVSTMQPGYIIGVNGFQNLGLGPGVLLGLNSQNTNGFAFQQLASNGGLPSYCSVAGMGCPLNWSSQNGSISITTNGRTYNLGSASQLPDSGISYMIVNAPGNTIPVSAGNCSDGSGTPQNCLASGTVQVFLPGQSQPAYSFTLGDTGNPSVPFGVQVTRDAPPSNLGRTFFDNLNYLYDPINGFVGYQAAGTNGTTATIIPMLALQGNLTLPNGFLSSFTTFLMGGLTLQQTGSGTLSGPIIGPGGLTLQGGNVTLGGKNAYGGGTIVNGGMLTVAGTGSITGDVTVNNGGGFTNNGTLGDNGLLTVNAGGSFTNNGTVNTPIQWQLNQGSFTNNGAFNGSLANTGTATNSGTLTGSVINTNTGTFINNGAVTGSVANMGVWNGNGSIGGNMVNSGVMGGNATILGNLANSGVISPGNSIGTINVTGNLVQSPSGTYLTEVVGQGQSDRVTVGGAASLGGTVVVSALPGLPFAPSTTYTILSAAGGLGGTTFSAVNELYPFLQSSLSYDANNAYLTLQVGGFAAAAQNPTQFAVGSALDLAAPTATGDFATVLGTLATQSASQVLPVLTSLSGMNYSGFSSSMVQGAQLFMNNFLSQAGGGSPGGNRLALAEACDVACDTVSPPRWGAWGGALGGLGTVGANQSLGGLTYNAGGFAAGLDRAITDTIRAGVTVGYLAGSQWESGFTGQGFSNTAQAGLYGGYAEGPVYLDGIVGYAYSANNLSRSIQIAGLAPRLATGQTGANQFYGQAEGGYRFDLGGPLASFVTPFARLQAYTGTQNAFTESGAQSLNLSVAAQTTNSLRSVLGAQLGGSTDVGWRDKLFAQLRLGWSHEYADVSRPVSASFVGAPSAPFTTYGAGPQRDGAVIGVAANTAVGEATSVYLRYEGTISGQDTAHALTAGVRMTW